MAAMVECVSLLVADEYGILGSNYIRTGYVVFFADVYQQFVVCLLYTSPSPRDATLSRMPSSA